MATLGVVRERAGERREARGGAKQRDIGGSGVIETERSEDIVGWGFGGGLVERAREGATLLGLERRASEASEERP